MKGKDFTTTAQKTINPALSFMSKQEPAVEETKQAQEPPILEPTQEPAKDVKMKLSPLYIEVKSRRLQLVLQPSLYARIKKIAENKGRSINDLMHSILEAYADQEEKRGL